jgi:ornithine cyclodeaminase
VRAGRAAVYYVRMSSEVLVLREPEIRELLDPQSCIEAMERAFAAYSGGSAELPSVIHLDVPERSGEIHVKAGHLHGGPYYGVKMVASFPGNPALGLSANSGMVLAFDAQTGAPAGFLLDNGLITDLRTGAAGAVAAKHLSSPNPRTVAVIGTGGQARYQVEMLSHVRSFAEVRIWGRDLAKARATADHLSRNPKLSATRFAVAESVEDAVSTADIVITVTASRAPLVHARWLKAGATVIALGSDAADKQELAVDVLARADRIVADSIPQCLVIGEIHHAVEAGVIAKDGILGELGEVVSGAKRGRATADEIVVCDLTGVGVQDVAAASLIMQRAKLHGRGERLKL